MDHPFLSRRADLARATTGLALAMDVQILSRMALDDCACLQTHHIPRMRDETVRDAATKHAGTLGALLEAFDACVVCDAHRLAPRFADEWSRLLQTGEAPSDAFRRALEEAAVGLRAARDEAAIVERDDGSSSYDDYSDHDSSTEEVSSSSEEEEEEEDKKPQTCLPKRKNDKRQRL